MTRHVAPSSSDLQRSPAFDWMMAYTRPPEPTERPMRPVSPLGRPLPVDLRHVFPPSSDRYTPPSGPPLVIVQGLRRNSYIPANIVSGRSGTRTRSDAPFDGP